MERSVSGGGRLGMTKLTTTTGAQMMGFDMYLTIHFEITSEGNPEQPPCYWHGGTHPDPPEWEISSIVMQLDEPGWLGAPFTIDGALFNVISELLQVKEAVDEATQLILSERRWSRRGRSRRPF